MEQEKNTNKGYDPTQAKTPLRVKIHRLLWTVVNQTIFRYSPFFCYGWRRFLLRCFGAKIASSATVGRRAIINSPWNLTMGERAMICNDAWVMCYAPVVIGDQSNVGEYARILTGGHVANSKTYKGIVSSVIIGNDCWIASCAILVSGGRRTLKIGDGAIVGAGSVVFLNVPRMAIMAGNPAEQIGERAFRQD